MDASNSMKVQILEKLIDKLMSGEFDEDESMEQMPADGSMEKDSHAKIEMLAIESDPKKAGMIVRI